MRSITILRTISQEGASIMPKPTDGYKLFTTRHEDRCYVGQTLTDTRHNRKVKVVRIEDRWEDGITVYDVYVVIAAHNGQERIIQ